MALSSYTAGSLWAAAVRDVGAEDYNERFEYDRYDIMNTAIRSVQSAFFSLFADAYMDYRLYVSSTRGKYAVDGLSSFDYATMTLTANLNTAFASGDVGKLVTFRGGANLYAGTIASRTSGTAVVLEGVGLPSASIGTVQSVHVVATTPSEDAINISAMPVMRIGGQIRVRLESTATDSLQEMTLEALRTWDTAAFQNKRKIAWCYQGDWILLAHGTGLTNCGTVVVRFPRMSRLVSDPTHGIDLPDGLPVNIALVLVKRRIEERLAHELADYKPKDRTQELTSLIQNLYASVGKAVKDEEVTRTREVLS